MNLHFVDVGVWKGKTAGLLLKRAPENVRLYLFEPDPSRVIDLAAKFGNDSRVTIYRAALTNYSGRGKFYRPAPGGEGSSLCREKINCIDAPSIQVNCMDGYKFIRDLPPGPVVLYSNCEGGEFFFVPPILNSDVHKRIVLWSVSFHYGSRKIPAKKPIWLEIEKKLDDLGIELVPGHFGKQDIRDGKLDEFVEKVLSHVPG